MKAEIKIQDTCKNLEDNEVKVKGQISEER